MRARRTSLALMFLVWACSLDGLNAQCVQKIGKAIYVGGTLPGWDYRYLEGNLLAWCHEMLVFSMTDPGLMIRTKAIRSVEYGPKPGRRALGLKINESAPAERHYLTLVYADPPDHEQVVVFDLATEIVQETLKFVADEAGISIDYQPDAKSLSPR